MEKIEVILLLIMSREFAIFCTYEVQNMIKIDYYSIRKNYRNVKEDNSTIYI